MFRKINKLTHINQQPINKISLIVIIIIDIFVLFHVFRGLNDIGNWYLTPYETYPCYSEWNNYLNNKDIDKDYTLLNQMISSYPKTYLYSYQETSENRLGDIASLCAEYKIFQQNINTPENQVIQTKINELQKDISNLNNENIRIRQEYDSSLLEKIAGQPTEQSINLVEAQEAKQSLEKNEQDIKKLKTEIENLKLELKTKPESIAFLGFLKNAESFNSISEGYEKANTWYPSIQIGLQVAFLAPLILLTLLLHIITQNKGYGLAALLSWHLLVIFLIPLIVKIFVFLQIGILFSTIFYFIKDLLGGLLFLISYLYILLVPLIGFLLILFFQKIVFNKDIQLANRVQKSRCIHCNKKIRSEDAYCPHCGTQQFRECSHCHKATYQGLPFCRACGHLEEPADNKA